MNSLFDNIERINTNYAKHNNSTYDYLNQTAREEFSMIRNTLEKWYIHFPIEEQNEFLGRFRSKNNQHHWGALLELFTHQLFYSFGYKVKKVTNSSDFIVFKDKEEVYLECSLSGNPLSDIMVEQQINIIADRLETLNSKFFINLTVKQNNRKSPAYGKLLKWIDKNISNIDGHEITEKTFFNLEFNSNGWMFKITLIPKVNFPQESRNMGIITPRAAKFINSSKYLYDAIQDKRPSKYGELKKPYIIILNSLDPTLDHDSIVQCFFRNQNIGYGFYGNSKNIKNTSVSGVLIIKGLSTTSIKNPNIEYWPNPWTKYPLELPFKKQKLKAEIPFFQFDIIEGATTEKICEVMNRPF